MHHARLVALVAALAVPACGDNHTPPAGDPDAAPSSPDSAPPDAPPSALCNEADPAASLAEIPGVVAVTPHGCGGAVLGPADCFAIDFDQPVDHANPGGPRFIQKLELLHRSCTASNLVADWGYASFGIFDDELSVAYRTNNLWIEHRFQGESVPAQADWDWTALTIENGANDMHRIIQAFRPHYTSNWVSTGASKGGITATYHKYFFPDDVDGSVPYVAPASRARVDPLYQDRLDTAFPQPCQQQMRDAQVAALTSRRAMMEARLTDIVPGFESPYVELIAEYLDWGFWQRWGVEYCGDVPTAASSDDEFWNFYATYSFIADAAAPGPQAWSDGALYYEWLTEQGFALQINSAVQPLLTEPWALATMEDNFHEMFPGVTLPAYDGTVTLATRTWVRDTAEDIVLIYGQYDPWTGGEMETPAHATSGKFEVPGATHGAQIGALDPVDVDAVLALLQPMFGHDPIPAKPAMQRAAANRQALLAAAERRAMTAALRWRRGRH